MKIGLKKEVLVTLVAVAMISGCSVNTTGVICPTCGEEEPFVEIEEIAVPECTREVAVVTYKDTCQVCGNFPVTVRTHAQTESCDK